MSEPLEPEFGSNEDYTDNLRFYYMLKSSLFTEYEAIPRGERGLFVEYCEDIAVAANRQRISVREWFMKQGISVVSEWLTPESLAYCELAEYIAKRGIS